MSPEQLTNNLDTLRMLIARKPTEYTAEYANTVNQSFSKYTNTRTVNLILSISELLRAFDWPVPLYLLSTKHNSFKFVFTASTAIVRVSVNRKAKFAPTQNQLTQTKHDIDSTMTHFFASYQKEIFRSWQQNNVLNQKKIKVNEIKHLYKGGHWHSCMTSTFSLIDHVARRMLNTNNLHKSVNTMSTYFQKAGISLEDLKPGYLTSEINNDLSLVGVALSSFLAITRIYYSHFTESNDSNTFSLVINRHAIMHGADNAKWSKVSATKLLLFLDLLLELETVFLVLFKDSESEYK